MCAGARCSGAGEGGGGEGRGSPPAALAPESSFPQELSSRPKLFYLPTNPPGSVSICCLGASLLAVTVCPRGKRVWGGGPEGRGRTGEASSCFLGSRCVRRAPPIPPQSSRGPHVQGTQPRRHPKEPPWGSFGAPRRPTKGSEDCA